MCFADEKTHPGTYRQCLLKRRDGNALVSTTCYLPSRLAVDGTVVEVRGRDGTWVAWDLVAAYGGEERGDVLVRHRDADVRAAGRGRSPLSREYRP